MLTTFLFAQSKPLLSATRAGQKFVSAAFAFY
jgi:hypothetical protein